MKTNPIIYSDVPDLDVIRVEDTYYMISTTMHTFPGGVILRSFDLVNWEILTYLFEELEGTPAQRLEEGQNIYGQGMWAASLRFHEGIYYICFACNDTGKTYLYQSETIMGPWRMSYIEGFYHDSSLLFDGNRAYLVYGNTDIYLTELNETLSAPKKDGLHRKIITDQESVTLGYEGSHIQKINGKYYVFLIHWLANQSKRRTQACFVSDSLEGEFRGRDVLDDDCGFHNAGVAQGGIVDTPYGDWYAVLFQDSGAIGRCPVLVPVFWENDFPIFGVNGKIPEKIEIKSTRENHRYQPLVENDDFEYKPDKEGKIQLKKVWQWNHIPDSTAWSVLANPGHLRIQSNRVSQNLVTAPNIITQRMMGPISEITVTVDGSNIKEGDYAGLCALQGCYGFVAITKKEKEYYLVMSAKQFNPNEGIWGPEGGDKEAGVEYARIRIQESKATFRIRANFEDSIDEAEFYYLERDTWVKIGKTHKLYYLLDHFMGCRVGLFQFSTKEVGGFAEFGRFVYHYKSTSDLKEVLE